MLLQIHLSKIKSEIKKTCAKDYTFTPQYTLTLLSIEITFIKNEKLLQLWRKLKKSLSYWKSLVKQAELN